MRITDIDLPFAELKAAVSGVLKRSSRTNQLSEVWNEGKDGKQRINVVIKALENVYFNYGEQIKTGYKHDDCQFYMPGFWYRRNLRSPKEAPSFHTSDSWLVREDRLSTPLQQLSTLQMVSQCRLSALIKFVLRRRWPLTKKERSLCPEKHP